MRSSISRRSMLGGTIGSFAALIAASPARAATTVSITDFGGSASAVDNTQALRSALAAAGYAGVVTIPAQTFNFTQPTQVNTRVTIQGSDPVTSRMFFNGTAYGLDFADSAAGSVVTKVGFYGPTSAFVRSLGPASGAASSAAVTMNGCEFYEPAQFAIQVETNGWMALSGACRFIGQGVARGQAGYVGSNGTLDVAAGTLVSGLDAGFHGIGAKRVTITGLEVNAMWWFANTSICSSTIKSVTSTSVTASTAINVPSALKLTSDLKDPSTGEQKYPTVTAWQTVTTTGKITAVAGKAGTYTATGFTPEVRQLLTAGVANGVIVSVSGSQFVVRHWNTASSRYPRPAPSSSTVKVERPFIARVLSANGSTLTIDRWHAGALAAVQSPPVGARMQVNNSLRYQVFATNATVDYSVTNSTIYHSWCDSISNIGGVNATITGNTIYDGQDTSITVERCTGSVTVRSNTAYRSGTATVFCAVVGAIIDANTSYGAQFMAGGDDSYGAFSMQGAANSRWTNNKAVRIGAPFENRAILLDGRFGQDRDQVYAPFATNVFFSGNTYSGYPKYDVTIRGTHGSAASGCSWASGTRFEATSGATLAMLGR